MAEKDVDIDRLFEPGQKEALKAYLLLLHPSDVAELFHLVDQANWTKITSHLSPEDLAEVLTHLEEHQVEDLGEVLQPQRLLEAVDELETDDAADVLADLPDEMSEAILPQLEDKDHIETLLAFPEDSAGGIMQIEVCSVEESKTVAGAIEAVRAAREEIEDIYDVYLVDADGALVGTVALEDLVLSADSRPLAELAEPIETKVHVDLDQEDVAQLFKKYDVAAIPVVDHANVLLGRITFDDVHDVIEEEASEDIMAMAGASTEELVYDGDMFRIAIFRLPWLLSSLLGLLVVTVLHRMFQEIPGETIVITGFVPVVMAMTGNVGSQSAMIITRGFAIGKVDLASIGRTFLRELFVAGIMALVLGAAVGSFAYFVHGDGTLGVALGVSMVSSITLASLVGTGAPALFKAIGIDPAIAAGPLVTTGCDVLGVSCYLVVAMAVIT